MAQKKRRRPDIRASLTEAARDQASVRIARSTLRRSNKVEGFVVAVGKVWVLLAVLDPNVDLDGYAALRLDDVSKVERRGGPDTFVGRALAARGQWPPVTVDVNLDDVADLLRTASDVAPLVTVHIEEDDPTVCYVGRPVRYSKRSVHMLDITPEAVWEKEPTEWPFVMLTRVEFGGRYEDALALVGGPPPV